MYLFKRRWYHRLVKTEGQKSLSDDYSMNELEKGIIVCWSSNKLLDGSTFVNQKGKPRKIYSLFRDYLELYDYMGLFKDEYKCFFEMIPGHKSQKIKFDIDLKDESKFDEIVGLVEMLVKSIIEQFREMKKKIDVSKNILIYTSHGPSQKSYHIVVDGYCFANIWEVKCIFEKILQRIDHPLKSSIDEAVYSSNQQFRIIGNQKCGSGRPKTLLETFEIDGISYKHYIPNDQPKPYHVLRSSLIGFTSDSVQLPLLHIIKYERKSYDVDDEKLEKMLKLFFDTFEGSDAFSLREIMSGYVVLDRNRESYCKSCKTVHEGENPYLFLEKGTVVYFSCRRSLKRQFVGCLSTFQSPSFSLLPTLPGSTETSEDIVNRFELSQKDKIVEKDTYIDLYESSSEDDDLIIPVVDDDLIIPVVD